MSLKDNITLTLEEVKNFLKVEQNEDDTLIERLINGAVDKAEEVTNRDFNSENNKGLDAVEVWILQRVARVYQRRIEGLSSEGVLGVSVNYGDEELKDLILLREEPGF